MDRGYPLLARGTPIDSNPSSPLPPEPEPHWEKLIVHLSPPNEKTGNPGSVLYAEYAQVGSEVRARCEGRIYVETIKPGDDVRFTASRLIRSKWGRSTGFHEEIYYTPRSIV